jgi:hypothetical protein
LGFSPCALFWPSKELAGAKARITLSRMVVYTANGEIIKTIQMRNLVCALYFDAHDQLWMGSGQDGQFPKLDRNGKVVGAVGNGMGIGPGQFIEASYFVLDQQDNLYAGDTSVGRITKMVAPQK